MLGLGAISAISTALSVIQSFFSSTSQEIVLGTFPGSGFWNYYGYSSVSNLSIYATRGAAYIEKMIDRIQADATPALQANRQELLDDLRDIADFESFSFGECSQLINSIHYNSNKGMLYFYCYHFIPYTKFGKEVVNVQSMVANIQMKLAQPFMVVGKIKANFFRAKYSTEIRYLPPEGLQQKDVVEALSIAFAPACLGLIQVPDEFFEIMKSIAVENAREQDPSISEDQVKAFENMFDAAAKRQKGVVDDLMSKAKETFGIAPHSLA